jgi:predicted transposase YdaD
VENDIIFPIVSLLKRDVNLVFEIIRMRLLKEGRKKGRKEGRKEGRKLEKMES